MRSLYHVMADSQLQQHISSTVNKAKPKGLTTGIPTWLGEVGRCCVVFCFFQSGCLGPVNPRQTVIKTDIIKNMTHLLQQAQTHKNNAPIQAAEDSNNLTQRINIRGFLCENRASSMHRALSSELGTCLQTKQTKHLFIWSSHSFRNSDSAGRSQKRSGYSIFFYLYVKAVLICQKYWKSQQTPNLTPTISTIYFMSRCERACINTYKTIIPQLWLIISYSFTLLFGMK